MILLIITVIGLFCNGLFYICHEDTNMIFSFVGRWHAKILDKRRKSFNKSALANSKKLGGKKYMDNVDKHVYKYDWLTAPLFGCFKCMTSVWGTLIYWLHYDFTLSNLYLWPIVIIASTAMSMLIFVNGTKKLL